MQVPLVLALQLVVSHVQEEDSQSQGEPSTVGDWARGEAQQLSSSAAQLSACLS